MLMFPRPGHTSLHDGTSVRSLSDQGTTRPVKISETTPSEQALSYNASTVSSAQQEKPHSDFWVLLEGFRPSGLLNKQAMTGKLSLENITHGHNNSDAVVKGDELDHIPADDPIRLGIVNSSVAATLFSR